MQSYEYKDEGGRFLCKLHHRLRCGECHYVSELKDESRNHHATIEKLLDMWKENLKATKQHNELNYSNYRAGLIEGLEFAIDELERVLKKNIV